jgi:hypothetical protein
LPFSTATVATWYATLRGAAIGLFFGVVFAFGGELADASEK